MCVTRNILNDSQLIRTHDYRSDFINIDLASHLRGVYLSSPRVLDIRHLHDEALRLQIICPRCVCVVSSVHILIVSLDVEAVLTRFTRVRRQSSSLFNMSMCVLCGWV